MIPLLGWAALGEAGAPTLEVRNFDVLAVVYRGKKGSREWLDDSEIARFQSGCELARLFYFRNTGGRLNLTFRYQLREGEAPDGKEISMEKLSEALKADGVQPFNQDIVFGYGRGFAGNYGGFTVLDHVGGAYGQTAERPLLSFYPEANPKTNYGAAWIVAHEIQHAIDLVLVPKSGLNLLHAHPYADKSERGFRGKYRGGEHWDWLALTLREFGNRNWLKVSGTTESTFKCDDSDNDGLADNDSRLPMDERRFGSDPRLGDSDGDGLTDLQEFCISPYLATNPVRTDTDNDGRMDGFDPIPYLGVPDEITGDLTTLTDRVIARSDQGGRVKAMASWSPEGLNFRFRAPRNFKVLLRLDGTYENGFWEGGDSYILRIENKKVLLNGKEVEGATVAEKKNRDDCDLDVFIPAKLGQGISEEINYGGERRKEFVVDGLSLKAGAVIGYSIQFEFDQQKFAILTPHFTMIPVRLAATN